MSVEIALLISVVSVAFSIFFGFKSSKHTDASGIEARAREMAEISVKLSNILAINSEIKEQLSSLTKNVQMHSERLTKVEELSKSNFEALRRVHERMDALDKEVDNMYRKAGEQK